MARIDGFGSLRQVLDQVTEVRILSADQPQWTGSRIEGLLGIDNIRPRAGALTSSGRQEQPLLALIV